MFCVCVVFSGGGSSAFVSSFFDNSDDNFLRLLSSLQRAVLGLEPGQDVLAAATVLPQLGYLLPQRRILPLQEGGTHRDLVLFQPPGVPGTLGGHVVLLSPGPVFLILGDEGGKERE